MVCVQVRSDRSKLVVGHDRCLLRLGRDEHPPATSVPFGPVGYRPSQPTFKRCPLSVLTAIGFIVLIRLQRCDDMLMTVSEANIVDRDVLAILFRKAGILNLSVRDPSVATVATQSWQPALSSGFPSRKTRCYRPLTSRRATRRDLRSRWSQGYAARARAFLSQSRVLEFLRQCRSPRPSDDASGYQAACASDVSSEESLSR